MKSILVTTATKKGNRMLKSLGVLAGLVVLFLTLTTFTCSAETDRGALQLQVPEGDIGNSEGIAVDIAKGSPAWSVNRMNLNLHVTDIPLWYIPPYGPQVNIRISYNSKAVIDSTAPFGKKWVLNLSSHLIEDPDGTVRVFMPDGRKETYAYNAGTYTKPYGVYNTLTKIAQNHFTLMFVDGMVYTYRIPAGTSLTAPVLVEVKDAYGNAVSILYNSLNRIENITDATGKTITLTYYADGHVQYVTDSFGRRAEFQYQNDTLTRVVDMGGYWTNYAYTTDGNIYLQTIENAKGIWQFLIEPNDSQPNNANPYPAPGTAMNNNYRLTITDPLGNKEEFYYYGPYTWHVSPKDYVTYVDATTNNFKTASKKKYYIDRTTPKAKITKIVYPEGGYIKYENFDAAGKPQTITDYHGKDAGNNDITHATQYTYNAYGLVTSTTDAKGKIITTEYYPNNIDVWKITNPLGSIEFTYNGSTHDVKTIKDRLGNITEFTYNIYGQLTKIEEAKGTPIQLTTEMVYSPTNYQLTEIKKGGSVISSFTYDTVGRVQTETGPTGVTTTYEYNNLDKVTKVTFPDTKYIQVNRSSLHPHLIDSIMDRSGLVTTYVHNALNQLTEVQGPIEGAINSYIYDYRYDKKGNLWKIIDMMKSPAAETVFEYNKDDNMTKKTYADGKFVTYTYDKMGQTKTFTNARNITTTYTFDGNHNLTSISYSDATPAVVFEYDDYNRMTRRTDGTGVTDFTYRADDALETVDGPLVNDAITYQYDQLGRLTTVAPQAGQALTYGYDALGRLDTIQNSASTFTYAYYGPGPLIQKLTRPNGSYTDYEYNDPLKRLTALINKASTGSLINSFVYTYEKDLIKTETATNGTIIDNFLEKTTTYQPNAVNQLVSATTAPNPAKVYGYDNDGNMTTGYTPDGYTLAMTYDAQNRMKTAQYTDSGSFSHILDYAYTGDSLLAEVKMDGGISPTGSTTKYLRSGFLPLQERDGNNAITREYTWGKNLGGGIGGLLNLKQGGQDYSYLYDGKGNVSALIDSTQAVVASYAYDPFGQLMKKSGTLDQPYTFSTKEAQSGTGQYYYGYRFYDSCSGKWTTRDPLEEAGGINLYQAVGNNPVNFVDPYGLFGLDTIGGWIGKQIAKQIGKAIAKKAIPDKGLNLPEHGDDDNDGTPNFMDPDSENCKVNCDKPLPPSKCH